MSYGYRPPRRLNLHWAINSRRSNRHLFDRKGNRLTPPFGLIYESHGCTVRVLEPPMPFAHTQRECQIERTNWHNRVHIPLARWIASDGRQTLEYGQTLCSGVGLTDPFYVDSPERLCSCGGTATICPRCLVIVRSLVTV